MISRKPREKKSTSPFEPIERSLYYGRRRLGRFVQLDRRKYQSFGADDRCLGTFLSKPKALAAIRKAAPAGAAG
jgi:hypothetical protein